ncbi:MAG: peptidylprolyl isomerase [Planctomycetota bacterium]|nr:peptidylprolyl isomerase [Planctomycetota bacterium]
MRDRARSTVLAALALASCAAPPERRWDSPPPATPGMKLADATPSPRRPKDKISLHPAGAPSPVFAALDAHLQQHPIDRGVADWRTRMPEPPASLPLPRRAECIWVLQTNHGAIRFRLRPDLAPAHVTNALWLTRAGFYDGLTFHRIVPGFVAQGGCPKGDGQGGPGYALRDEIPEPPPQHDRRGILSAAHAGPNTAGSQFFITLRPAPWLDGIHTVFGELETGEAVLATLEAQGGADGKPRKPVTILRADFLFREASDTPPNR